MFQNGTLQPQMTGVGQYIYMHTLIQVSSESEFGDTAEFLPLDRYVYQQEDG